MARLTPCAARPMALRARRARLEERLLAAGSTGENLAFTRSLVGYGADRELRPAAQSLDHDAATTPGTRSTHTFRRPAPRRSRALACRRWIRVSSRSTMTRTTPGTLALRAGPLAALDTLSLDPPPRR